MQQGATQFLSALWGDSMVKMPLRIITAAVAACMIGTGLWPVRRDRFRQALQGSNPAGGTLYEVPKDPAISGFAENGVFAYVQACVAVCRRMTAAAAYSRPEPWGRFTQVRGLKRGRPRNRSRGLAEGLTHHSLVLVEQVLDPPIRHLLTPVEALGVPTQQHLDAVAGALGNLGGVHAGVEPGGERGVPKVVRAGKRRRPAVEQGVGLPARPGNRSRRRPLPRSR